jgi:hypothetical protein
MNSAETPPLAELEGSAELEASPIDEELAQLPPPPRAERTWSVVLLSASALGALALAFAFRTEATFALKQGANAELGELGSQVLTPGQAVSFRATFAATGATQMDRPLTEGSERIVPVLGRDDVWVAVRTSELPQTGRFSPTSAVTGHVVPLATPGAHFRGTWESVTSALGKAPPANAVLVIQGEVPAGLRWALLLMIACVLFASWNTFTVFQLLRRVKRED